VSTAVTRRSKRPESGLIDHLREQGLTLTYDSRDRTLRTGTKDPVALTV
jgi:hypothetical protein